MISKIFVSNKGFQSVFQGDRTEPKRRANIETLGL